MKNGPVRFQNIWKIEALITISVKFISPCKSHAMPACTSSAMVTGRNRLIPFAAMVAAASEPTIAIAELIDKARNADSCSHQYPGAASY